MLPVSGHPADRPTRETGREGRAADGGHVPNVGGVVAIVNISLPSSAPWILSWFLSVQMMRNASCRAGAGGRVGQRIMGAHVDADPHAPAVRDARRRDLILEVEQPVERRRDDAKRV
jgi:hypothetical protein